MSSLATRWAYCKTGSYLSSGKPSLSPYRKCQRAMLTSSQQRFHTFAYDNCWTARESRQCRGLRSHVPSRRDLSVYITRANSGEINTRMELSSKLSLPLFHIEPSAQDAAQQTSSSRTNSPHLPGTRQPTSAKQPLSSWPHFVKRASYIARTAFHDIS